MYWTSHCELPTPAYQDSVLLRKKGVTWGKGQTPEQKERHGSGWESPRYCSSLLVPVGKEAGTLNLFFPSSLTKKCYICTQWTSDLDFAQVQS